MPFQPGQSGNPGGRPKENAELKALARTHTTEAIEKLVMWMRGENPKASVSACLAILDRAYGKPAQAIIGGDEDDPPIQVITKVERVIVHARPIMSAVPAPPLEAV